MEIPEGLFKIILMHQTLVVVLVDAVA